MNKMRRFSLERIEDATGVSGVGNIAEGILFSDGIVAMRWITEHKSTCVYDSITEVVAIHGHGGRTVVVWQDFGPVDGPVIKEREASDLCTECGTDGPDCGCVVTDWGTGQTFQRWGSYGSAGRRARSPKWSGSVARVTIVAMTPSVSFIGQAFRFGSASVAGSRRSGSRRRWASSCRARR